MPKRIITCFPLDYAEKRLLSADCFRSQIFELTESKAGRRLLRSYTVLFLSEYTELDEQQRSLLLERLRSDTVQTNAFNGILSELFAGLPKSQSEPEQQIDVPLFSDNDEDDYDDYDDYDDDFDDDEDDYDDDEEDEYDYDDDDADGREPKSSLLSKLRDWFYPEE